MNIQFDKKKIDLIRVKLFDRDITMTQAIQEKIFPPDVIDLLCNKLKPGTHAKLLMIKGMEDSDGVKTPKEIVEAVVYYVDPSIN